MREVFLDITGYEGLYQISNMGRVRCIGKHLSKEYIMRTKTPPKNDYLRVQLRKDRIYKCHLLHRLVATHFIPNPSNKEQVNHKDGIKSHCSVFNLEWATRSENTMHAIKLGLVKFRIGDQHHSVKLTDKIVGQIRSIRRLNQTQIAKIYKVDRSTISKIVNNKRRVAV